MKASSLQGIVRQPIGGLKPNSSSARLSKSWNEGWLKYDIGTTNLFLCISPTYIATCPFGTSGWFLQWRDLPLIICLTLWIMDGKRMPMLIWFWASKGWFEMGFFFGWKLWKSCGMRRLFWVCIYRVFFWGGLPYFSSGEAVGCMFSGCGCFAILGTIGGPMATKVHMA